MEGTSPPENQPATPPGKRPPPHRQMWGWYRSQTRGVQWLVAGVLLVFVIVAATSGSGGGGGGPTKQSVVIQQQEQTRKDNAAAEAARVEARKARAKARRARAAARRERLKARRAARQLRAARQATAARLELKRQAQAAARRERKRQQQLQQQQASNCDPNYSGQCLDPSLGDYDCAAGSGDGPGYVEGTVTVVGEDIYDLDRDGDGTGCD